MIELTTLDIIRLFVFAGFGIFLSYYDLRERKIYNKHLLAMAITGLILFSISANFDLFPSLLTNFSLALLIGIIFWKIGIWSAGDGKLFSICTLYLPFKLYIPFFHSSIILVNTFILAFFIWFLPLLIKTKRKEKRDALIKTFNKRLITDLILTIFGLFYFIGYFFSFLNLNVYSSGYIVTLIFALALFAILQKIIPNRLTYLLIVLCALRVISDHSIFSFSFWIIFLMTLFVILIAMWVGNLSLYISYDEKYLKDIKEGDVPIGAIVKGNKKIDFENFLEKNFGSKDILKRGFSKEDIEKFKEIKDVRGFVTKKYISFTPLMVISLLLVSLFKVDILLYTFSGIYYMFFE